MDIEIYEYYDGYEHLWEEEDENDRVRVKYFVLGDIDDRKLMICYFGDTYNFLSALGKRTHSKAWVHSTISAKDAIKCVNNGSLSLRHTKKGLLEKIVKLKERRDELDAEKAMVVDRSASVSMSEYGISFHWEHGESYTDKFIHELEQLIRLIEVRDEFLANNRMV
jgi:hypothetical protein